MPVLTRLVSLDDQWIERNPLSPVVIGVDAHKRSHTMVAVDAVGRRLAVKTIGTTSEDHLKAVEWARQWPDAKFVLEDCRHVTRRFERDLLGAGLEVVRVPTHLMAAARRGGREKGKSDRRLISSVRSVTRKVEVYLSPFPCGDGVVDRS